MLVEFAELEEWQNKLIEAEKIISLLRTELAEAKNIAQCMVRGGKWTETKDRLPESGVPVLVFVQGVYGDKTRRLRAHYAEKNTLVQSDLFEGDDTDYDDDTGTCYCKEGWYEANEFEEVHWRIDGEVTHWMPLPESPRG